MLSVMMLASAAMLMFASGCFAVTVTLNWGASSGSTGYRVYYKADSPALPFNGTGAAQGASPINVGNQTSATISGLDPAHSYYFAVTAYNASGESSYSNLVSIPELTPPTTAITYPANNAGVGGTVAVTASASDNVGVSKVEFYVNGTLMGTDTSTPYTYSWITSSLAAGNYTLMTRAYDAAGNVGQSGNVVVSVARDTTAPTVSLTSPAAGATVSGTVTVSASAGDAVGISRVEFYLNSTLLSASNVAPFSYSWNTASVTNGSYALSARAYDASGNVGTSSQRTVTVSNAATSTTSTATSTAATTAPPTISTVGLAAATVGRAYSAGLGATGGVSPYTWSLASGVLPAGLSLSSTTGAITGTPTSSGTYSITFRVTDSRGATATRALSISVGAAPVAALVINTSTITVKYGQASSTTLSASGGLAPYTWGIVASSVPFGMSFNGSTGQLFMLPTRLGTFPVNFKVTDSRGTAVIKTVSIVVSPF